MTLTSPDPSLLTNAVGRRWASRDVAPSRRSRSTGVTMRTGIVMARPSRMASRRATRATGLPPRDHRPTRHAAYHDGLREIMIRTKTQRASLVTVECAALECITQREWIRGGTQGAFPY